MKKTIIISTLMVLSTLSQAQSNHFSPEEKQLAKIGMNYETSSNGSVKREIVLGDPDFLSKFNESLSYMNVKEVRVFGNSSWGMDQMKNFLIDKPVDFAKLKFIEVNDNAQKIVFEGSLK